MCTDNDIKAFFVSILKEDDISYFGAKSLTSVERLFERGKAKELFRQNTCVFLKKYQETVSILKLKTTDDSCSNTVKKALVLLKLIDINVCFNLDVELLTELLIDLSNQIQMLQTIYKNYKYDESNWGFLIAHQARMKVNEILTHIDAEAKTVQVSNFVVNAISQISVTNTVLASWNHFVLKHYGIGVSKKVTRVVKALNLYDHLLGEGTKNLLLNNTKDKVERKLKPLKDIGLQDIVEKILGFYMCKNGNEKKRFLYDIEKFIGDVDICNRVDAFLVHN